jgi:hypothetical protein
MSCDYCWPGNCCGGPNCLSSAADSVSPDSETMIKNCTFSDTALAAQDQPAAPGDAERERVIRDVKRLTEYFTAGQIAMIVAAIRMASPPSLRTAQKET